ncbi:hypothetical protein BH09VER1_BH09VER1_21770 [soil metagenome]
MSYCKHMKTFLAGSLLLFMALSSLSAGTFQFPDDNPVVSVTIPATWKPSEDETGVEATSKDEEVYIDIQSTNTKTVEKGIDDALAYLKDKGVTVTADSVKKQELKLNGLNVFEIAWDGTDEDGACKISLSVISVTDNQGLLVIYWASPEGEKKNQAALNQIANSITPLAK